MCCDNILYVWNGSSLCWNRTSLCQTEQSCKGLLLGPMRKVARFRGPQSHIVCSSHFFPPLEIFYDTVSVLTRLFKKLLQLPNFLLACKSLIPFHHFSEHRSSAYFCPLSSALTNLYFSLTLSIPLSPSPLLSLTPVWDLAPHRLSLCSLFVLQGQAAAPSLPRSLASKPW